MRARPWLVPLAVVGMLSLGGCAEKNREALARMKPEFAPLRARLAKLAPQIEALKPAAAPPQLALSPPPVFDKVKSEYNTDVISFEQLTDDAAKPKLDLIVSGRLVSALQDTGDHPEMVSGALELRHGKEMEASMRAALAYRYLIVYRTVELIEPRVLDEHTFTPGRVVMALYLVDLANGDRLVPLGVAVGHTSPATEYLYKKGDDQRERLGSFAHSTLWQSVRTDVRAKLAGATGGRILFD
jgi:hypothetical protein